MNSADGINVRQRQYAFAKQNTAQNLLVTRNILFCTAWFGFDRGNGLAFLCHFDSVKSTNELPRIVDELQKLGSQKLNLESYIINGTCIAGPIRTFAVRNKIMEQARNLLICPHQPEDLRFSNFWQRSKVYVSANWMDWLREDYLISGKYKVSTVSLCCGMNKANGSA